ncbi:MAG: UDP-N-acetylglucosamine--N-acetylmuramyl-(pentapeptide) pyrophosphoryl-undecaprenol N-acetylglucosamine transferase [Helicobacteraceae bacterium]|jgi:UDP-N-acetylglucosamine--N-acetylmuramyl-(pentapeptide) pyrophosphoryl-undecaprenol N-acetylglucosamine transferase|nr:UDP-N-acetylglucosamine--N-acetylmuramyl-(pentapeptide) pyrophosphoryl-undecaprenol N-acetylglucosamine transferase [Helicobacteraceae bacterium]
MIAISGGGTGGHLAVVRAVKEALVKDGVKPLFIGSKSGQDQAWFEHDKDFAARFFLPSSGVINKQGIARIFALSNILTLAFKAAGIIRSHGVKTLFCVGGYSAAPAALAAVALRIPLVLHEQNAVKGSLNRLLTPFAKRVFSSFEEPFDGYPISSVFFETARVRNTIKSVIFLGGSQGAKAINDYAMLCAPLLKQRSIRIIHQTGSKDLSRVQAFYAENGIEAVVFDFARDLVKHIAKADLAVARSGAGTLFELAANGLPAIFIPYPHAAGAHQKANARFLSGKELAWCVEQHCATTEIFASVLCCKLKDISRGLIDLIPKNGAETIATTLIQTLQKAR